MEAADTLPYSVVNCLAFSPTCCSIARRSFMSSSSRPASSAILNVSVSTPCCVSLRFSMRESSSGPISETVVRTGWPCLPYMSQNTTGQASFVKSTSFSCSTRSLILPLSSPACDAPARSPLTSAMNTGTPMRLNASAMRCKVTVFPVPVAPAIRPWRLARAGSRHRSSSPCVSLAINKGSGMALSVIKFCSL